MEPEAGPRKPRRFGCLAAILALPFSCCVFWPLSNECYERWELGRLESMVVESKLPGSVLFKDGRNDWPFGTSNGAFVRYQWTIVSNDKKRMQTFAQELRRNKRVEVDLWDVGPAPYNMQERELSGLDARIYNLRLSYRRDNYWWEIPD